MLTIRLNRVGKRKESRFRIVVQEKSKAPSSNFLETLGHYNPHAESRVTNLKVERAKYWLNHGAKPSDTVYNIFIEHDILEGEKIDLGQPKKKQVKEEEKKESGEQKAGEDKKEAPAKKEETPKPAEVKNETKDKPSSL